MMMMHACPTCIAEIADIISPSRSVPVGIIVYSKETKHFYRIGEDGGSGQPPLTVHLRTDDVT